MVPKDNNSAEATPASARHIGSAIPRAIIRENMTPNVFIPQLSLRQQHLNNEWNAQPAPKKAPASGPSVKINGIRIIAKITSKMFTHKLKGNPGHKA